MSRPAGLGRGLNALLGDSGGNSTASVSEVELGAILPNPRQPRSHFDEAALAELAESIRRHGVLQPIVLRETTRGRYEIIAGERRWRAAQQAGLSRIPALVREADEQAKLAIGIVENIQREQLNALEEGEAYRRLIEEFGLTAEDVAQAVHKSRSHVANLMRLADLPASVRALLADGRLSMGHARALLGHADIERLAQRIAAENLSVRDAEALAKPGKARGASAKPRPRDVRDDDDLLLLERQLGDLLGLKVAVQHEGKGGRVVLTYGSLEQLDLICQRLSGERI